MKESSGPPNARTPSGVNARALVWTLMSLVAVTALKLYAFEYIGPSTPFLLYFVSIITATWFGGWGAGIATTVVSGLLGAFFFMEPYRTARINDGATAVRLAVFLVEGITITWIVARRRSVSARVTSAAHRLEVSLAKMRGVLAGVMDGITVQDAGGNLIFANEPAAKLAGCSSVEELLKLPPADMLERLEVFDEKGQQLPLSELPGRRALQGLPAEERVVRFRLGATGEERWSLVRANGIHIEGSDVLYAVNVFRDITESRAHEESVRVQREWLSTTLRSIGDAVIATDAQGRVMLMNPVAELLTGWTSTEAEGQPLPSIFRIINEQTRMTVQSPVDQVMREGKVVGLANHTTLISRNAKEVSIDDSAAPIRAADGRLIGTVLVFRDVTERRDTERRSTFIARATAELASSLDYKQTLATVSRLAVPLIADWCAVDLVDGKTLQRVAVDHVDPEKVRLVYDIQKKYPEDPERPGGAYEVIRTGKPIFIPEITDALLAAAARDQEHLALIRQLQLNSYIGMPLLINDTVVGVLALAMAESGRVYGPKDLELASALADRAALAVNHARLFAESASARTEAERANRAKDEFLAMLGHELRNPLAPILTALQLMKLRSSGTLDREQAILERQVKHVVALVDDLLDISRITSGKIPHVSEVVDLAATIGRALEVTNLRIKENAHNVVTDVPPGLLVNGDPIRLTQVFTNLITNAAKYTPPGGLIHIKATRQEETLVVVVKDNGLGIEPELLPRLFDMFVQGEQPLDRAKGGLGLGLAIVRSLVELHGGRVFASSAGIKQGSEFRVVLPALNATTQPVPETKKDELKITTALKVLLVDDNEDALELLGEALKLIGYETFSAPNSFAALSLAALVKPHVALLDIGLPDIDGYELARRLRALEGLSNIKLVALTGYSQAADRSKTSEAGFNEHLVKPTSLDQIQEVIERLTAAKA